jgi:hypothetical protein
MVFSKFYTLASVLASVSLLFIVLPIQAAPSAPDTPASPAQDNLIVLQSELTGLEETPAVVTQASGRAAFVLDEDTNILYFRVVVWDIEDITAAHLHPGLPGEVGPAEIVLFPNTDQLFNVDRPLGGNVQLTQEQVDTLLMGGYYINVHTTTHPPGEIRGQVVPFIPAEYNALLQDTPLVVTDASGWARFTFTGTDFAVLNYEIRLSDITGVTGAQLHPGLPTQIQSPEVSFNLLGVSPFIGTVSLAPQQLADFLAGYNYLTIQTTTFPTGELRGQVTTGYHPFRASPAENDDIQGHAILVLAQDMQSLYFTWRFEGISQPVELLLVDVNGVTIATLGNGPVILSAAQVTQLAAGNYFIVIPGAPPGTRYPLEIYTPEEQFNISLTPLPGAPPLARGSATLRLNTDRNFDMFHYHLWVHGLANPISAALYAGWETEQGDIIVLLYPAFPGDEREFMPNEPLSGDLRLGAGDLANLLAGAVFVLVTTDEMPQGALRGQVGDQFVIYQPLIVHGTLPWLETQP